MYPEFEAIVKALQHQVKSNTTKKNGKEMIYPNIEAVAGTLYKNVLTKFGNGQMDSNCNRGNKSLVIAILTRRAKKDLSILPRILLKICR
jgi:hypothetical protein